MKSLLTTLSILAITGNLTNVILNTSSQKIQFLDNKIQQDTIYIDKDGKQVKTSEVDLSNINSKEVIQIGFFQNREGIIQVVKMPVTIEKVSDHLPSEIRSLKNMFMDARAFNQDISKWNTSNVVDMSYMFSNASSFNQNLSSWNIAHVTNMSSMFAGAKKFNQDISNWDVVNVTTMHAMFYDALSFNQNFGMATLFRTIFW
ncbi:BspA family leucine-rich repeat surface protein [Spiroplasma endosymbiont of Dactylopius coccus]|nr:DUF285 domain-containing protein [Spiroplasma ixodetis]